MSLQGNTRNYGLDLYKVLCMFMVVGFHYVDHGNTQLVRNMDITFNWNVLAFLKMFGAICNCAFMLNSGYFLYEKEFKIQNLIRL